VLYYRIKDGIGYHNIKTNRMNAKIIIINKKKIPRNPFITICNKKNEQA
jgi:hypothetical protein